MKRLVSLLIAVLLSAPLTAKENNEIILTPQNTVSLRGVINSRSVSQVIKQIHSSSAEKLYLYIVSPGGSVMDGHSLIGAIKSSGKDIECIADFAASMAFVIFQNCKVRHILTHSILMQHEAFFMALGQTPNVRSRVNFIERILVITDKEQASRLGLSYEDFKKKTRDDWWLFGPDIITAKAADGYVTVKCSKRLTKAWKKENRMTFFGGSRTFYYSRCPLITAPIDKPKKSRDDEDEYLFLEPPQKHDDYKYLRTIESSIIKEINKITL